MSTPETDILTLGAAPRPSSDAELSARLRDALVASAGVEPASAERVQVTATSSGADVPSLAVDLTGVTLSPREARAAQGTGGFAVVRRERGTIGSLRVDAHPVTVVGAGADVQVEATDVPFEWVEGAGGELGVVGVEPDEAHAVHGSARVAIPVRDLEAAAERVAAQLAAANGLRLTRLDLRLTPAGANGIAVVAEAQVKKSLLSATVEAAMTATVDDALGVTVRDVRVTSRNPVVAALLGAVRSKVDRYDGRRVDLVAELPAGLRLTDVTVTVGQDVVLTARAH
ncbi:hypothetical protein KIN34_14155 [Cellulomonas sp. DKR-3]|uniref:Uncharacterized protein n=1 Tax=Cellulomonas fulva TaxID=2835530 RepID=A0ABS5U214_9CELL|nr:hypothetical protein [Cellulomonas fulva]MBT0995428.1 hypothetical protein [Cellulomonas fulva]